MDTRGKYNRKRFTNLHYESTSYALSFKLKLLMFYKNIKRFYLKEGDGSKQELEEITQ
jgi:hypothetical protein